MAWLSLKGKGEACSTGCRLPGRRGGAGASGESRGGDGGSGLKSAPAHMWR